MRSDGPTFWLLDGRNDWRTCPGAPPSKVEHVSAGRTGLRLAADPSGPLGLTSKDGSLGGLVLPRRFAFDAEGVLYLLGPEGDPWVKRFDLDEQRLETLPGLGGEGAGLRQFHRPRNLAIAGRLLYVADAGNRRVQVFALGSLALRHAWDAAGRDWEPYDVAAHGDVAYILDRRQGRVYRHRAGWEGPRRVALREPTEPDHWDRIAVDRDGRIYLAAGSRPYLAIYDAEGRPQELAVTDDPIPDSGPYRDRFDPPPIRLADRDRDGKEQQFCLPDALLRPCGHRGPMAGVDLDQPLSACPPWSGSGRNFDGLGNPVVVDPSQSVGRPLYRSSGTWISGPLDSRIHRCRWHRIELELAKLPVGTRLEVSTFATPGPELPDSALRCREPDECALVWDLCYRAAGSMPSRRGKPPRRVGPCPHPALPPRGATPDPDEPERRGPHEFLVQSREGRYLWIKVALFGDGYSSPVIDAITAHYPRRSYLDYLPAVYSADDEGRRFLEQFLATFQTTWDDLDCEITNFARYFDPKAVPSGPPLDYLARWLALPTEGAWDDRQRRRLLRAAPRLAARRGTPAALRDYLRVALRNIAGPVVDETPTFPLLVEGFRERRRLTLGAEGLDQVGWVEDAERAATSRVEHGTPLWSDGVVGRMRLGSFDREGEARIHSAGSPGLDLYREHAHRFRVVVPAAWVASADDERTLRRAVEGEKPAHASYDLCLVEPRFRVGVQATVGIDTILGATRPLRLADLGDEDSPPSRPPRHRLGYDTVLAGESPVGADLRLDAGARLGIDAVIS